jgi:hypothetical protein
MENSKEGEIVYYKAYVISALNVKMDPGGHIEYMASKVKPGEAE